MFILADNWWAFLLRGVLAVLFGLMTFILPGMALATLVFLFGLYVITEGVFNLVAAVRGARDKASRWWYLLIEGLLSIVAGLFAFIMPGVTAIALVYLIAAWALMTGVMEIGAAIRLRKHIAGEWMLAIAGVVSILLGVMLALFPSAGVLTVVWWIGAYAVVFGVLLITLGFRLRKLTRGAGPHGDDLTGVALGH
ncbi:MAG TPA: HdeD family acid-resistance protein [Phycisphaerae bacterium]|nr:HdeD family acid-resistance protein [Phycisphaerae bacterium]